MEFFTKFKPKKSVGIEFKLPSLAQQHFKDECDINTIIANFQQTGVMPSGKREPLFGDFSGVPQDFMSAQNLFDEAQERFYSLSSDIRKRFNNNPAELLHFMSNPANADVAFDMGLINKPIGYDERHGVQSQKTPVTATNVQPQEIKPVSPSPDKA